MLDVKFSDGSVYELDAVKYFDNLAEHFHKTVSELGKVTINSIYDETELEAKYKWKGEDYTSEPLKVDTDLEKVVLKPGEIKQFIAVFSAEKSSKLIAE